MLVASQSEHRRFHTFAVFFSSHREGCDATPCAHTKQKNTIETRTNEDDSQHFLGTHRRDLAAGFLITTNLFHRNSTLPQTEWNRIELNLLPHPVLASSQCVLLCLEVLSKHYFPSIDRSIVKPETGYCCIEPNDGASKLS
jgi:hypothetical protein